ncbi:MAG: hypothetical protein J6O70_02445 [Lachnospiraceae bacterium]|nr:hypothetical protein [Lachnospiraceae bacterium]
MIISQGEEPITKTYKIKAVHAMINESDKRFAIEYIRAPDNVNSRH